MSHPSRILIVKFSGIGDIINITPAIRLIKKVYPHAEIDVLASTWNESALRHNPHIRKVIAINSKWLNKLGVLPMSHIIKAILKIRKEKYEAALVFQQSNLFKLFIKYAGIKKAFLFGDDALAKNEVAFDETIHIIENNLNLTGKFLEALGASPQSITAALTASGKETEWVITPKEKEEAENILATHQIPPDTKLIGLIAGGAYNPVRDEAEIRQWGAKNYKELLGKLATQNQLKVVLIGGENDVALANELAQGHNGFVINLAGKVSLRASAAILAKCNLAITNDTGPLHIAGAVNTPLIGIFGPTAGKWVMPLNNKSITIQSQLPCSPCYYRAFTGCIYDEIKCMKLITADEVYAAVREALQ